MSLKKYSEKRHFDRTPEPPPSAKGPGTGARDNIVSSGITPAICITICAWKSVELSNSWAVPKGPTLDPAEKRLAMMVEDHPIEYGSFEGIIPEGNYGAGSVMLWDRGTYELLGDASAEEQLARGDFKFRLHGEKITGEFAIVRMKRGKGNEWLLLKKKDASAQPGWEAEDHAVSVSDRANPGGDRSGAESNAAGRRPWSPCPRSAHQCWRRSEPANLRAIPSGSTR